MLLGERMLEVHQVFGNNFLLDGAITLPGLWKRRRFTYRRLQTTQKVTYASCNPFAPLIVLKKTGENCLLVIHKFFGRF